MFNGSLMLLVDLPVVGTIHTKGSKSVTGMKTKAMGDSKFNDSLALPILVPVVSVTVRKLVFK